MGALSIPEDPRPQTGPRTGVLGNEKWSQWDYLDTFHLSSAGEQTPDGLNETLVVIVTHALNFFIMSLDSHIKTIHELVWFSTIINSSAKIIEPINHRVVNQGRGGILS